MACLFLPISLYLYFLNFFISTLKYLDKQWQGMINSNERQQLGIGTHICRPRIGRLRQDLRLAWAT